MKKIILSLFLTGFFVASYGQQPADILIDDFEGANKAWAKVDGNDITLDVVDNPVKAGINTSSKVMRAVRKAGTPFWTGLILRGQTSRTFGSNENQYRFAHVKVLKVTGGGTMGFKLENGGDSGSTSAPTKTYTSNNVWQEVIFDLGGAYGTAYRDFFIQVDVTDPLAQDVTVYIDDIVFKGDPDAGNPPVVEPGDWRLVWMDDFNGDQLDETAWTIQVNCDGGGNQELQCYRRENVSIGKEPVSGENCLILTAKKEATSGKAATSGRVTTANKMRFKYGKIEGRLKIPQTGNGLWPAFWMMGDDIGSVGWPKCGEIDIMEMGNTNGINAGTQSRYFGGHFHWGENMPQPNWGKAHTWAYSLQDDFTLWTLVWDSNSVKMYLDLDKYPNNSPYVEMAINGGTAAGQAGRYFNKPFHVLLNLAVGGTFTGITGNNNIDRVTAFNKATDGEPKMYIDYIKVYQKGDEGESYNGPKMVTGIDETLADGLLFDVYCMEGWLSVAGDVTPDALALYNLAGQKVLNVRNTNAADVSGLPKGIYILKIQVSGKEEIHKIVIND